MMSKISRLTLALIAALFLVCFQFGFNQWQASGHSLIDTWRAFTQDWLLCITMIDAGLFTLICLTFFGMDLHRRALVWWKKLAWFMATLVWGAPVLLLYLAFRPFDNKVV